MHFMHRVIPQAEQLLWMDSESSGLLPGEQGESGMTINNRDSVEAGNHSIGGIGRIVIRFDVVRAADRRVNALLRNDFVNKGLM
ncbi:MAG: hypothetical protein ACXIVE_11975 [Salinarimonas sp.]